MATPLPELGPEPIRGPEDPGVVAEEHDGVEGIDHRTEVAGGLDAYVAHPRRAGGTGGERRRVGGHDLQAPALQVQRHPSGAAAHVEDAPTNLSNGAAFCLGPVLEGGQVQLGTGAGFEKTVLAFVDLEICASFGPVDQRLAEGISGVDGVTVTRGGGCQAEPVLSVDLNADVGEEAMDGADEEKLLGLVTSASIGCAVHAGTVAGVSATVRTAARAGVVIGAHPSYPDRAGVGRRPLDIDQGALAESLVEQIATVQDFARTAGSPVRFVKPHGALYHRAGHDEDQARLLADVVDRATAAARRAGDLAQSHGTLLLLLGAGAPMLSVLESLGVSVATEAFADRAYLPDGSLVPRDRPGAVLTDEAAVVGQARSLVVDGRVLAVDGSWVEVSASSLCLHGDTPAALSLAGRVRRVMEEASVCLAPFAS